MNVLISITSVPSDEKQVIINQESGGQPSHADFVAKVQNGNLIVINETTTVERWSAPFDQVLINGVPYSTPEEVLTAIGYIGNFRKGGENPLTPVINFGDTNEYDTGRVDITDGDRIIYGKWIIQNLSQSTGNTIITSGIIMRKLRKIEGVVTRSTLSVYFYPINCYTPSFYIAVYNTGSLSTQFNIDWAGLETGMTAYIYIEYTKP